MARITTALWMMGLLVIGGVTATSAQESSHAPVEGTGVTLPQYGFAATLPEGWLVICPWSEEALGALGARGATRDPGEPLDEEERVIVETMAAMFAECQFVAIRLADEGPAVSDVCKADAGALAPGTFDLNIAYLSEVLSSSEDTVAIATAPQDLPAGQAAVIDVEYRTRTPRHWANYLIEGDEVILALACAGPERPDDDWLSIAESFEFLPEEG